MVILLPTGKSYEAEICVILLLLRCAFRSWYTFLPKSKFSVSGRKPWTIIYVVRGFDRNRGDFLRSFYSTFVTVEGAMKLKFAPLCPS